MKSFRAVIVVGPYRRSGELANLDINGCGEDWVVLIEEILRGAAHYNPVVRFGPSSGCIEVEVDLDPVPGTYHQPEDWVALIQDAFTHLLHHHQLHPVVRHVGPLKPPEQADNLTRVFHAAMGREIE